MTIRGAAKILRYLCMLRGAESRVVVIRMSDSNVQVHLEDQ